MRRIPAILLVVFGASLPAPARAVWPLDGAPVCTVAGEQSRPAIASDGAGGAIVVWEDPRGSAPDLYAQRIDSSGVALWMAGGVLVSTIGADKRTPTIAPGYGGGALIAWRGESAILAQLLDGNGQPQWGAGGSLLGYTDYEDLEPRAIPDNASGATVLPGWIVAWRTSIVDMRAERVDVSGGGRWTANEAGIVIAEGFPFGISPYAITTDGVGTLNQPKGAVVAWVEGLSTQSIRAQRVTGTGVVQWGANGVAVCDAPGIPEAPDLANVGSGNVAIAWQDWRAGRPDLYAQKLSSLGQPHWIADGNPICTATGDQVAPRVVRDGSGGFYVVWQDQRAGGAKIYAQHLDVTGVPLWTANGIPLCATFGEQTQPVVVTDGAGGFIVAWRDTRSGGQDLYAQRVSGAGTLLWVASGLPLTEAGGDQAAPVLVADGKFGVIGAWSDPRVSATEADVYANRIGANGFTVDVASESPAGLRLALVSPNPVAGKVVFRLQLPQRATVGADVLDVLGRRVRTIVTDAELPAGAHDLVWDGADAAGRRVEPGMYFVRVRAGAHRRVARIVELR